MKSIKLILALLFVAGTFGLSVAPAWADGVLFRAKLQGTNYCHMKFPAIRADTLGSGRPVLRSANSGDLIDFYGPCDYDPLGEAEIERQSDALNDPRNQE